MDDGSQELSRFADLLRIGAEAARQVARLRPWDAIDIERLAREAERMAVEFDAMAAGAPPPGSAPLAN